ncbi:hypothetical protein GCK72_022119 [Caenorhabditis remanei]|uniref:Uncharacterized protein n=1 Tax=Caenorhabditis remanei TaxID=31234 RepID=A0A6A5FSZ2_CAERE|nr:hypothetical protein GCK72_022119 [Caenorhabditis remanei]KAF1745672.1 hypothetical protein GCK72_022119 [Caenorhabditis remanei]
MYYDGNFLHLGYNRYTGMFNHKNLHTTKFLQLKWMCQTSCKIGRKKAPNPTFEDILKLPVENRFWYPERDHSVYS